jgi:ketosteroid isomerase-like protein
VEQLSQADAEAITTGLIDSMLGRDVERLKTFFTDDSHLIPLRAAVDGTTYSGPDAPRALADGLHTSWRDMKMRVDEVSVRGTTMLGRALFTGISIDNEVPFEQRMVWIAQTHDGLITHLETFTDENAARATFEQL